MTRIMRARRFIDWLKVQLYGLSNVGHRVFYAIAFAYAAGKRRHESRVTAVLAGLQYHFEDHRAYSSWGRTR